jgi:hypothetical protein
MLATCNKTIVTVGIKTTGGLMGVTLKNKIALKGNIL